MELDARQEIAPNMCRGEMMDAESDFTLFCFGLKVNILCLIPCEVIYSE